MNFDTTPEHRDSYIAPAPRRARRQRRRPVNWRSASTPKTLMLQARVRWLLERSEEGFTVRELAHELGISRQLCLYHVKKMAATSQIVMMLEPCLESGGLRFRCWNQMQLVVNFQVAA